MTALTRIFSFIIIIPIITAFSCKRLQKLETIAGTFAESLDDFSLRR